MRVKIISPIVFFEGNNHHAPPVGEVMEMGDEAAERLIAAGIAESVTSAEPPADPPKPAQRTRKSSSKDAPAPTPET